MYIADGRMRGPIANMGQLVGKRKLTEMRMLDSGISIDEFDILLSIIYVYILKILSFKMHRIALYFS